MAENKLNRITRPNGDLLRVRGDLKYIQGTGTAAVTSSPYCFSKWEAADTNIDSLFDGLMIAYRVPVAGNGTYGTCLSLNGGDYHPVVVQTNTMISTRYGVGAVILLVYSSAVTGSVYGTTAGASATAAANITGCWVAVNNYVDGNTDTKNTAGSTDTSSKIFLVGATTQAANPQTYSDNQVYVTNGQLDANQVRVAEVVTLQYNSTNKSLDFIFA